MWSSFIRLLERAAALSFEYMGVTAVGFGLGLFVFLMIEADVWRRGGWNAVKKRFAGSAGFGFLATVIVWLGLFGFCVMKAVYDNHQSLVNANSQKRKTIDEKDKTIGTQKEAIQTLEAKLKEQPKVDQPSKGPVARTPPTINNLFVEATAVCSLRDPLKLPLMISNQIPPGMGAFFEGPTGKAYLRNLYPVAFQRMEERDKALTVLRFDLPNNSDLTGKPVSTLSRYDRMQINLWAINYNAFTQCGFVELTLRMNGTDIHREEIRNLPPTKQDAYYQILIAVKKIQLPQ